MEVKIMTIVWFGSLMFLVSRLVKRRYKQERITVSLEETIKRYGVYYFCIDDLPL